MALFRLRWLGKAVVCVSGINEDAFFIAYATVYIDR